MSEIKYCKDCRFCRPNYSLWWFCIFLPLAPIFAWGAWKFQWEFAKCGRAPKADGLVSPVSTSFFFCSTRHAYMINVASFKNGVGYGKWIHIDGFSENVIRFIVENEAQG